ncbi:Integral membrane protein hemolysin-III homolog [Striga hermonthica]|uniref:Integral membrane protein hemolysin-III homolog n=1 Tax=Striga hermonthica TaxID=68872 RepID=A0A9N7NT48_STRHE|nr:Integral membrane protein hemolysin-III homolog [Striga hermonthica]
MINTQHSKNGPAASGSTAPPAHNKQPSMAPKKTALRDLQNENERTIHKQQDSLLLGKQNGDSIKVCGTKRLTPERPHGLNISGANENVMNARRRFELELGRGRLQNNIERFSELKNIGNANRAPVNVSGNLKPAVAFPGNGLPVPISSVKNSNVNGMAAAKAAPSEAARAIEPKVMGLLRLSPSELSKHAVELEKRAIQLTIEEGNEMQRMRTLNILAKSSPTNNLLQSNQLLPPNKR